MQPQNTNPYDFIMQDGQQPKKNSGSTPQSQIKKIVLMVAFISVVFIVLIVGFVVFQTLTKPKTGDLVDLAAHQTEILRITDLGLESARDSNVRARVQTLRGFIMSDLKKTSELLTQAGTEPSELQLAKYENADLENDLELATQRNAVDSMLVELLDAQIAQYKGVLQSSLSTGSDPDKTAVIEAIATNILVYEAL